MTNANFKQIFKTKPIYRIITPSRVNLIGEHVDYFGGFSMPMAIENIKMIGLMSPRKDGEIWLYSNNTNDQSPLIKIKITSRRHQHQWVQYVQGAISQFKKVFGSSLKGFNLLIDSTIPIGGGLSSSSALTLTALVVCGLANGFYINKQKIDIKKSIKLINSKAKKAQQLLEELSLAGCKAEWWYGTKGGAMDHFAITASRQNYAILLDNLDFSYEYVKIPADLAIIVCNTMVRHNQLYSGYAERKTDARNGFEKIKKFLPKNQRSIRNLTPEILEKYKNKLTKTEYRRLLHPVTENRRVFAFKEALEAKNYAQAGQILNKAFESLRDNYEVSCEELNMMQEAAIKSPGCFGARITGGGFGGCIVALVGKQKVSEFIEKTKKLYNENPKIKNQKIAAEIWAIRSSDGIKIQRLH